MSKWLLLHGVMKKHLKLIEVWGDGAIQAMLEGSRRNKDTFLRISNESGWL